jgi:hypothetical protein
LHGVGLTNKFRVGFVNKKKLIIFAALFDKINEDEKDISTFSKKEKK